MNRLAQDAPPDGGTLRAFEAQAEPLLVIDIAGMTCAACAVRIERGLNALPELKQAQVDLASDRAVVIPAAGVAPKLAQAAALAQILRAGYHGFARGETLAARANARKTREAEQARAEFLARWQAVAAFGLALPFWLAMAIEITRGAHGHVLDPWMQLALASLVQFVCAYAFYGRAWAALRAGVPNMDVLVVLGTLTAYGLSVWHIVAGRAHDGLYFEGSVSVIAFVLLGKLLERHARMGAGAALQALEQVLPERVLTLENGQERLCERAELAIGMLARIKPGGVVPADGVIVAGQAYFDLSALNGESVPVLRGAGENIEAGALVSGGMIDIRIEAVEDETRLARLARLIEDAGLARAPVLTLVDRISAIFVPTVIALAGLTFAFWLWVGAGFEHAALIGASVLVVACPCALGLATPITLVAGANASARAGLIVTDHGAFDAGAKLNTLAFDKTGTLTQGLPQVQRVIALQDLPERATPANDSLLSESLLSESPPDLAKQADMGALSHNQAIVLALAAALAAASDHPLDRAIVAAIPQAKLANGQAMPGLAPVEDFEAHIGAGLRGRVGGEEVLLGARVFLDPTGAQNAAFVRLEAALEAALAGAASSVSYLGRSGQVLGVLALGDQLREGTQEALQALAQQGLHTVLFSGDRPQAVAALAHRLGISAFHGGMKPEDKLSALRALPGTRGFVGDGLNDGPVLKAAEIGFAIGTGTEVAKGAASVILARPDLRLVPKFITISRYVQRGLTQNLALAFIFNAVAIPLAMSGHLTPALAGAAMALSSVTVALNALRLARICV